MSQLYRYLSAILAVTTVFYSEIASAQDNPPTTSTNELLMADENLERTEAKLRDMESSILEQLNAPTANKNDAAPVKQATTPQADPIDEVRAALSLDEPNKVEKTTTTTVKVSKPEVIKTTKKAEPVVVKTEVVKVTQTGPTNTDLERKLAIAESQVKILSRELDTTRKSLSTAEKRIDDLSGLVQTKESCEPKPNESTADFYSRCYSSEVANDKIKEQLDRSNAPTTTTATTSTQQHVAKIAQVEPRLPVPTSNSSEEPSTQSNTTEDSSPVEYAAISVARVPLRIGPSIHDPTLILIPQGNRVKIEFRNGQWYRVITSGGIRGWINAAALVFNTSPNSDSAVKVAAYNPRYEPEGLSF